MVILHVSQVAVASFVITVLLEKEILWQFQNDGQKYQQLARNVVGDVSRETLNVLTVRIDNLRMPALQFRDELGDVVDLRVVIDTRTDLTEPHRLVPIVPAVLQVSAVFQLLFCGELEELFANRELAIDIFLAETEVGDVEKANLFDGVEELLG